MSYIVLYLIMQHRNNHNCIDLKLSQGLYETKMPIDFNAILQLGCVCQPDKSLKGNSD